MKEIVVVNNLSLTYQSEEGEIVAINDLTFSVNEGEFVSIIGPSGCGKSTLLSIIAGLIPPTSGEVILNGHHRTPIGYMLQKDSLFPWRTIYQNVILGLEVTKQKNEENLLYVTTLLKTYGLWDFKDSYPGQLSGGMRQRCALIRTLAVSPGLLLLDEPFSALDYQTRLAVNDDIYAIIKREKKTAIMVSHDIAEAVSMSDRVIVLSKRPAVIKSEYKIDFGEQRTTPLACREADQFRDYFNKIWRDIDVHV